MHSGRAFEPYPLEYAAQRPVVGGWSPTIPHAPALARAPCRFRLGDPSAGVLPASKRRSQHPFHRCQGGAAQPNELAVAPIAETFAPSRLRFADECDSACELLSPQFAFNTAALRDLEISAPYRHHDPFYGHALISSVTLALKRLGSRINGAPSLLHPWLLIICVYTTTHPPPTIRPLPSFRPSDFPSSSTPSRLCPWCKGARPDPHNFPYRKTRPRAPHCHASPHLHSSGPISTGIQSQSRSSHSPRRRARDLLPLLGASSGNGGPVHDPMTTIRPSAPSPSWYARECQRCSARSFSCSWSAFHPGQGQA
ncbi:hypothetical protein B0H19DRAFT_1194731 [Mycena capillaripes]|nr:hypothetical protein B0H19DRAFT_1194731 [Mycena capillaripes]